METAADAKESRVYGVRCVIWRLVLIAIGAPSLRRELMCRPAVKYNKSFLH